MVTGYCHVLFGVCQNKCRRRNTEWVTAILPSSGSTERFPAHKGCCRWPIEMWGHWQPRSQSVCAGSLHQTNGVYPLVQAQAPWHIPFIFPVGKRVQGAAWLVTLVPWTLYNSTCSSLAPNTCLLSLLGEPKDPTSVRKCRIWWQSPLCHQEAEGKDMDLWHPLFNSHCITCLE